MKINNIRHLNFCLLCFAISCGIVATQENTDDDATLAVAIGGIDDDAKAIMDDDDGYGYDDDYFDPHPWTTNILPKPFSILSMISSYVIIREVLKDHKANSTSNRAAASNGGPVARVLLAMSIIDIIFSFVYFLGTWPVPNMYENTAEFGNYWYRGSITFCNFQGFFIQFGQMAVPFYNTILALYYFLMIRRGWTDMQLRKTEWMCHGLVLLISLIASVIPLFLKYYNGSWYVCWIEPSPYYCEGEDCERGGGDGASWYGLGTTVFNWCCLFLSIALMGVIFHKVWITENLSKKYATSAATAAPDKTSSSNTTNTNQQQQTTTVAINRAKSKAVATQALFYTLAFFLTYFLDFVAITWSFKDPWNFNYWLDVFAYTVAFPMQGFFNFLVFARNRGEMKTPEGRLLRKMCYCTCFGRSCFRTPILPTTTTSSSAQNKTRFTNGTGVSQNTEGSISHTASEVPGHNNSQSILTSVVEEHDDVAVETTTA